MNSSAAPASQESRLDEESVRKLAGELQTLTAAVLEQALNKLFAGADDALFEMARKAGNNRDQAKFLDAMRSVRLARSRIRQRFAQEIEQGWRTEAGHDSEVSLPSNEDQDLVLADSTELEKTIAITNIANRADELFKQPLWQLGRRINTLVHAGHAAIPPLALAPLRFCDAFRIAVDSQRVESGHALVLYQLFDRIVIPDLDKLYSKLLEVFDRHSIRPEKISGSNLAASEQVPSPAPSRMPGPARPEAAQGVAQQPDASAATSAATLSPQAPGAYTLQMLQQWRSGANAVPANQGYTDQHLADDLVGAALGRAIPGWETGHAQAYVRRTDAVGHMFSGIVEDPDMPDELKPRFDELRFTVIKTALQDVNFFANPTHPVRGLVNDLATLAAAARTTSVETLKRVKELVGQIQDQFRVAAESVRRPRVDPLESAEIETFLAEQIDRNRERRKAVIEKAKRVVEEELQLRCARHNVPNTALTLLRSGWGAMMAAHLMRSGIDGTPWRDGIQLLENILTALDPAAPPPAEGPAALVASIDSQLSEVGMIGTRRKELLEAFLPALRQAELKRRAGAAAASTTAGPVNEQPVTREALLKALVVPGSWFRIVDTDAGQSRWMKVVTYYPGHDNVAFAEFNGRNSLFVDLEQFFSRLLDDTIQPVELLPMARDQLDRYRRQKAAPAP